MEDGVEKAISSISRVKITRDPSYLSLHAGNGKCLWDEINSRCTNMGDVYELGISKFGLAMFN